MPYADAGRMGAARYARPREPRGHRQLSTRGAAARLGTALLCALLAISSPGEAQALRPSPGPAAGADSAARRARETASRAQASFERRRRSLLPRAGSMAGRCDVRIGRYCYWYDPDAPPGPDEPARVATARARLLTILDSAALADPADDLIAGQRVRYRLESGATDSALAAALACAGSGWWCAALRGWALHAAGDAAAAGAAFDSALAAMPRDGRCAWSDISHLLDGEARERYTRQDCDARAALERRFWWLATPFFSRGGNDRRNEHLARRALAQLARESPTTYDSRWGDDMEELLVRYGWAERWSRRDGTPGLQQHGASVIGHEPSPAHLWAASARLLETPYAAAIDDWEPHAADARGRYAAPVARLLLDLDASAAAFVRGDSMLVVTTFAPPREARLEGAPASVVLSREEAPPSITPFAPDGSGGVAAVLVGRAPQLVSVEILADSGAAARARFAVSPPAPVRGALALSDLLPYRPERGADTTFDDAVRLALRGSSIAAPQRLGIYWELYGLPDGRHAIETSLSIVAEREGWLARMWQRARGHGARAPVNLHWTDLIAARDGIAPRAVAIELPPLEPGDYELVLHLRSADGHYASAFRRLRVRR